MLAKVSYDLPLFLFRLSFGGAMLLAHGLPKLMDYSNKAVNFPDPLMVGSSVSLALLIFAEVFCSSAIILGFCTRLASIPPVIAMTVAFLVIHGGDPFAKKEIAFLFLIAFAVIGLMGAGRWSIDYALHRMYAGKPPRIFRVNLPQEHQK